MPKADELVPAFDLMPLVMSTDDLTAMIAERADLQSHMQRAYREYQEYTVEVANLTSRIQQRLKDMGAV